MDQPRVTYRTAVDGRVAVVSLNRPRYRNALSLQTMDELDAAFDHAVADEQVRVIVLRGEGPVFCAGHDLGSPDTEAQREVRARSPRTAATIFEHTRRLDIDHYLRYRNLPVPTIAMVHGPCILAAWMLASSMDVIFAAEDSTFLMTDFEYFSVPWDIGVRKTKELCFENRFLSAREALAYGFVQRLAPATRLEDDVMAYAARVAEQDRVRLRFAKASLNQVLDIQGFTTYVVGHHMGPWAISRSSSETAMPTTRGRYGVTRHALPPRGLSDE
jgi:enoyl-CoA hydratase